MHAKCISAIIYMKGCVCIFQTSKDETLSDGAQNVYCMFLEIGMWLGIMPTLQVSNVCCNYGSVLHVQLTLSWGC